MRKSTLELKKCKCDYIIRNITIIAILYIAYACSSQHKDIQSPIVSCKLDSSKIIVDVDTNHTYKYFLNVGPVLVDSGIVKQHKEFLLYKVIKDTEMYRKEIALNAAKNGLIHKIRFKINDVLDTTFTFRQIITEIPHEKISFSGFGAPLIRKSQKENLESELRVWLYRRQEQLSDSLFEAFRSVYSELSRSEDNEYIPVGKIPVVRDLVNDKYKIKSDIKADYYAIVACQVQDYIDQFIEGLVGNNFANADTSLAVPLSCHYMKGTSGYRNVFLLCINKDWSYKQIPIATFAFDNSAPKSNLYNAVNIRNQRSVYYSSETSTTGMEPTYLSYKNKIKVLYPNDSPQIYGDASVTVTNFDGNRLECNVTFRVELNGDAKSATIQRRGELCYPDKYFGNHFKPEDKVIYAKDHNGAYTFTYKMHFDDGDNIIPIIIEDYNGNKHYGSITVYAEFERVNTPTINIDNNIDIYNN